MTFANDTPKSRSPWLYSTFIFLGAMVVMLVMVYIYVNATPTGAVEPRIDSSFEDRNQTRVELIDIINRQRAAVYSSYVLEYAFCLDRMDGEVKQSYRSNLEIEGEMTKMLVHCTASDASTSTHVLEYDQATGAYKESKRLLLNNS